MDFVTVEGQTFNLHHLVKYVTHTGQREVGTTASVVDPEPIFDDFRFVELVFSDGSRFRLDAVQTEAFLKAVERHGRVIDLDKIEEAAFGRAIVSDDEIGGDIILPEPEPES